MRTMFQLCTPSDDEQSKRGSHVVDVGKHELGVAESGFRVIRLMLLIL